MLEESTPVKTEVATEVEGTSGEVKFTETEGTGVEGTEGTEGTGVEGTEGIQPPAKQSFQERINELTWKYRQEQRDRKALEERLNKVAPPEPQVSQNTRPAQDNFETTEEYEDALIGWHNSNTVAKLQQEEERKSEARTLETFHTNAAPLREAHEDFDDMVEQPVFTDTMRKTVFALDNGPMLAYHLGKNPDLATMIGNLAPERQIYEVYKLETSLLLAQKKKTTSNAPAPLSPVGISGGGAVDESKMDDEAWFKMDQARRLEKIKRKVKGE